ncbi:MAG: indolepyruvate oxidoreductase subunit beta [Thermoplasmata archaeon]
MNNFEVIVAGVGGQGSVLASHIIADAAIKDGKRARVGETFGAAQRGGAVSSHVRIGDVYAPTCVSKSANAILALELLEGARASAKYLANNGIAVLSSECIMPVDVSIGLAKYPSLSSVVEQISKIGKVLVVDARTLAEKAGSQKCANVVMLGALYGTGMLPISKKSLLESISERVPKKTIETNINGFSLGEEYVKKINNTNNAKANDT